MAYKDLTGQTFHNLTALRDTGRKGPHGEFWECSCACGKVAVVSSSSLRNGHTKSCGCAKVAHMRRLGLAELRHGDSRGGGRRTAEYGIWSQMRGRCQCETNAGWAHYGGRGITVDPRWESFEVFLADMGRRPSAKHSIDRIDNDKGYSRENCRWVTKLTQVRNRRNTRRVTLDGVTRPLAEWIELGVCTVSHKQFYYRLKLGMSDVDALTKPSYGSGPKAKKPA